MAVIEELVAKLGFDVEGLAKLKAAAKEFDRTKKAVIASSSPLKSAGASAGVAAIGVGKLGSESKRSSRGVLLMGTALTSLRRGAVVAAGVLRTVVAVLLRLAVTAAGAVAGMAALGAIMAVVGAKAALARREFAMAAKEIGSTGQNLETLGNVMRGLGFGDEADKEAKRVASAMDEIAKAVRKGGEDAVEAKKKIAGFGIDKAFNVDPKTGKSRDSSALALDAIKAYKTAAEKTDALRKQADALEKKSPKRAAALRQKAIGQDQKNEEFATNAGIEGRLKVEIDQKSLAQIKAAAEAQARMRPTTSDASEKRMGEVAEQAQQAGDKLGALLKGVLDRLIEIGVALASHVLPPLNSFLDKMVEFAETAGIIKETVGRRRERLDRESETTRENNRAKGLSAKPEETAQQRRRRTQDEADYRARQARLDREGIPTEAPLPPERPTQLTPTPPERPKDGSVGPQGKAGEDGKHAVQPRGLPARDKDISPAPPRTPTTVIRETQADLPARLEALRRKMEADQRSKPGVKREPQTDAVAPIEGNTFLAGFKAIVDSIPSILSQVSPEVNAAKMQKAAESKVENDQRKYENIGNDQRTISPSITVNATGLEAVAAAVKNSVLGAISAKGSNTSTAAINAP